MAQNMPDQKIGSPQYNGDDFILPFQTVRSNVLGRIVRLGPLIDDILSSHDYPAGVSQILGEAIALSALLGTALKFDGNLILQTRSDGPVGFLVVNFETPGKLRGYAAFNADAQADLTQTSRDTQSKLLGNGHLAITIDPDGDMDRYQGIVALNNQPLVDAADTYFRQSEQLPTFIHLSLARHYSAGTNGEPGTWQWRAGGLLLQHVSPEGGTQSGPAPHGPGSTTTDDDDAQAQAEAKSPAQDPAAAQDLAAEAPLAMVGEEDDHWQRVRYLAQTVEDHELLDPNLTPDRLLYRLFHEEGVRVGDTRPLRKFCRCSLERIKDMLRGFGRAELSQLRDETGKLSVTCEFCATTYRVDENQIS